MNEDLLPEEQDTANEQILKLLSHPSSTHTFITETEKSQIIEKVRGQLMDEKTYAQAGIIAPLQLAGQFNVQLAKKQHRKRLLITFNALAAVLIVGLLVGSWILLSTRGTHPTPMSIQPSVATGPSITSQAKGIEASMHVLVGGPYFLSELLPVEIKITNHTQQALSLPQSIGKQRGTCLITSPIVQVTKGTDLSYTLPTLTIPCADVAIPVDGYPRMTLKPGASTTIDQYIPLTKSGSIKLTLGDVKDIKALTPLVGHEPSMPLQVESTVPTDRQLSLQNQGTQVIVKLPAGATPNLLYMTTINCDNQMGSPDTRGTWTPLKTTTLNQPSCPLPHKDWYYIVSAPGYPIVAGEYKS